MDNPPAEVIASLLVLLNVASDAEAVERLTWPVYVGDEPDLPDKVITVYDTSGTDDGRSMVDGEIFGHYGLQIRIRSTGYKSGWIKGHDIITALSEEVQNTPVTITGSQYLVAAVVKFGDVISLGKETPTSNRRVFTVNCLVSIKQTNEVMHNRLPIRSVSPLLTPPSPSSSPSSPIQESSPSSPSSPPAAPKRRTSTKGGTRTRK